MKQINKVLKALIDNPKKEFTAVDFQSGEYFIGYEATARISDVVRLYPDLVKIGKIKRFRTIRLNEENVELINEIKGELENE
jgi:hypothetical protein